MIKDMQSVRNFARMGRKQPVTKKTIKNGIITIIFFSVWGIIVSLSQMQIIFIGLYILLGVAYIVFADIMRKKTENPLYIPIYNGTSLMFMSGINLLISLQLAYIVINVIAILAIIIFYLLLQFVYIFLLLQSAYRGDYRERTNIKAKNYIPHILVGFFGMLIGRTFFSNASQNTVFVGLLVCTLILSILTSVGTINFLRMYLIKKYNFSLED